VVDVTASSLYPDYLFQVKHAVELDTESEFATIDIPGQTISKVSEFVSPVTRFDPAPPNVVFIWKSEIVGN
jgi:hypothetical protein